MNNEKCEVCSEPTKYPMGFWDSFDDDSGLVLGSFLWDCQNTNCEIKRERIAAGQNAERKQEQVRAANAENNVDVKALRKLRISEACLLYDLAIIAGVSTAKYSAWENEREAMPPEIYAVCLVYLGGN
jgi:DNA-binding transcriptional regulator YiaG